MTQAEYDRRLDELDRLLNDPDVPMQPGRIWSILADLSRRDGTGQAVLTNGRANEMRQAAE